LVGVRVPVQAPVEPLRVVGDYQQRAVLRQPGQQGEHGDIDVLGGTRVTDQAWQNSFHVAIGVSAAAALGCALACREDFRADLTRISVPVLIVQGSRDRVMPLAATGNPLAVMLADARLVVIPHGPHAITWTHAAQVNQALLGFLRDLHKAPR
jgi:non-heme chloroperoxidase